jgi:hypothetical protein
LGTLILSPIFRQVEITIILVEDDKPNQLHIKIPKPCNVTTMTPLVIKRVINPVDLAKKANPYLRMKNTSKNLKVCSSMKVTNADV